MHSACAPACWKTFICLGQVSAVIPRPVAVVVGCGFCVVWRLCHRGFKAHWSVGELGLVFIARAVFFQRGQLVWLARNAPVCLKFIADALSNHRAINAFEAVFFETGVSVGPTNKSLSTITTHFFCGSS